MIHVHRQQAKQTTNQNQELQKQTFTDADLSTQGLLKGRMTDLSLTRQVLYDLFTDLPQGLQYDLITDLSASGPYDPVTDLCVIMPL